MKPLWKQFQRFLPWRWQLIAGALCVGLAAGGSIWSTRLFGRALDQLRSASNTEFIRGWLALVVGVALVSGVFNFAKRWWMVGVSRYFETQLKQDLFDKLVSLPFSFHTKNRSGDLVSRLTSDVENVRMFLGPGVMYCLTAFVMVPLSLFYLIRLDASIALWMLIPLTTMGLGMKLLSGRLERHSLAVQESIADIGHRAQESFGGIRVVKGYNREEQQIARFDAASRKNLGHQIELARAQGLMNAITWGSKDFTFLPIVLVGGLSMINRGLPAGDLFVCFDLVAKLFWPIVALGWMAGVLPRAMVSAKRIEDLLATESHIRDPREPARLAHVGGALALEHVSFSYDGSVRRAVDDVSVSVPARSVLGVVGPTGSGKTTLLNLLARLFEGEGVIRLDGVPVQQLPLATLRGALGYVPQDSFLFSDTWRENVGFGAEERLDDAKIAELAELACMTGEVATFPGGFDQRIGERGVTLSGGQRQRTCIARALAREPRVLVLDDALSAVDTETEVQLVRNIQNAGEGRTVVIAAHRLSTVRHAGQILVLDQGRVVQRGTHDELIDQPGWYSDTWARQQTQEELAEL